MMQPESGLWPYSERNGVGSAADVELLLGEPEIQLSDQERGVALAFANGLFQGYLSDGLRVTGANPEEKPRTLEQIAQTSTAASRQTFYLDYFKTKQGQEDARSLGINLESDVPATEQLYRLSVADEPISGKVRKEIASRSRDWYKQELAGRLGRSRDEDAAQPDSEVIEVNFVPEKLLAKFAELQAYRAFYRQVHRLLRQEPASPLNEARQTLLDVHSAKVNSLAAEAYPSLNGLAQQLGYLPDSDKAARWRDGLRMSAPVAARMVAQDEAARSELALDFSRRLDLVRNGAAWHEGEHRALPVSSELQSLAADLSVATSRSSEALQQLPTDVVERMRATRWNAEQMQKFCETVLAEWDLLSEHRTDWNAADERSGFAPDQKWQVVVTPKVSSLAVNGNKKVVSIPEKFDRTLVQVAPAGVLPVAAHELTHVLQTEYAYALGQQLPLARIKGRRYITAYEMGGIYQERELHAMVGQSRPTNVTYLRALETKLAGGNQTEAARAFAEAKGGDISADQAAAAGKNALRLYRYGGHDSQALDYTEQELLLRALEILPKEQVMAVSIAGSSFSLHDAAALHRVGLLELPREISERPAQDVMRIFLEDFYRSS